MDCIHFRVHGKPVPQGSVRRGGRGQVIAVTPQLRAWRNLIRAASLEQWGQREPFDGPVGVHALFVLAAPQRPLFRVPATPPDLDKLIRGVGDSLSHTKDQRGIIADDSRIINWNAAKAYGTNPGVLITVDFNLTPSQLVAFELG